MCVQVPGLSAPVPLGAAFGFQPGGWGKAPVDERGEPLYGDVFAQHVDEEDDLQVAVCACLDKLPPASCPCRRDWLPEAYVQRVVQHAHASSTQQGSDHGQPMRSAWPAGREDAGV